MTIANFESNTPQIDVSAFVDPAAFVLGKVTIGKDSSVWPMTVIRGDVHEITIGDETSIQDGTICHATHDSNYEPGGHCLKIGNRVTVGHRVILHGCTVEDDCIVGMGSTVLDGAIIQQQVILGANSLVPSGKVLESGFLFLGSPVKKVRPLTDKEMEFLRYSAEHYVRLKNRHMVELAED